ncbi:ribonuclease III [Lichenihabitans sp. Uapishka_5]|uniref:ribonuclease III n=1 Tax=Lichenihabitans sp. Uapishka_5 TaxID=3037302 RepID=UPI0029E81407|nr:ribonuclease III [Lichenihabitans sp. Uapishka_5]MDX7950767.1 ribonuclease III [Lichenihabitans sp. Uapishka_5]
MSRTAALAVVEAHLGHTFADRGLLAHALTHISALPADRARIGSYQRLEFLGDRVLGLVVSAMLYEAFPNAEEGEMSRRLAALVRRETCAEIAREWQVGQAVFLGDNEAGAGGREKPAILSDICEALIGAVFIEAGFERAAAIVRAAWTERMRQPSRPLQDPKTALQEWAQGRGRPTPLYRETGRTGPAHAPVFTLSVTVDGCAPASGSGTSKRVAEQVAAQTFLQREGLLAPVAAKAER